MVESTTISLHQGVGGRQRIPAASLGASHSLSVLSQLPLTIRFPSGLNATHITPPVCPLSVRVSWPVAASHTLTVWSSLPLTIRFPSGLNATLLIEPVCPLHVRVSLPVATSQTFSVLS